jgi:hypothetical protein
MSAAWCSWQLQPPRPLATLLPVPRSYSDSGQVPLGLARAPSRAPGSFIGSQAPLASFLRRLNSGAGATAMERRRRVSRSGPEPFSEADGPEPAEPVAGRAPSAFAARARSSGGGSAGSAGSGGGAGAGGGAAAAGAGFGRPRVATLSIDEDEYDEEAAWRASKERAAREAAAEDASGADRPWWEFKTGDPLLDRHITRVDVEGGMAWTDGKEGEPDGGRRLGRAAGTRAMAPVAAAPVMRAEGSRIQSLPAPPHAADVPAPLPAERLQHWWELGPRAPFDPARDIEHVPGTRLSFDARSLRARRPSVRFRNTINVLAPSARWVAPGLGLLAGPRAAVGACPQRCATHMSNCTSQSPLPPTPNSTTPQRRAPPRLQLRRAGDRRARPAGHRRRRRRRERGVLLGARLLRDVGACGQQGLCGAPAVAAAGTRTRACTPSRLSPLCAAGVLMPPSTTPNPPRMQLELAVPAVCGRRRIPVPPLEQGALAPCDPGPCAPQPQPRRRHGGGGRDGRRGRGRPAAQCVAVAARPVCKGARGRVPPGTAGGRRRGRRQRRPRAPRQRRERPRGAGRRAANRRGARGREPPAARRAHLLAALPGRLPHDHPGAAAPRRGRAAAPLEQGAG